MNTTRPQNRWFIFKKFNDKQATRSTRSSSTQEIKSCTKKNGKKTDLVDDNKKPVFTPENTMTLRNGK